MVRANREGADRGFLCLQHLAPKPETPVPTCLSLAPRPYPREMTLNLRTELECLAAHFLAAFKGAAKMGEGFAFTANLF
jgi:hypothetical protein